MAQAVTQGRRVTLRTRRAPPPPQPYCTAPRTCTNGGAAPAAAQSAQAAQSTVQHRTAPRTRACAIYLASRCPCAPAPSRLPALLPASLCAGAQVRAQARIAGLVPTQSSPNLIRRSVTTRRGSRTVPNHRRLALAKPATLHACYAATAAGIYQPRNAAPAAPCRRSAAERVYSCLPPRTQ